MFWTDNEAKKSDAQPARSWVDWAGEQAAGGLSSVRGILGYEAQAKALRPEPAVATDAEPVATRAPTPEAPSEAAKATPAWANKATAYNAGRGYSDRRWTAVQQLLGVEATGKPDPATASAVKAWQEAEGLTADGYVGPKTMKALEEAVVRQQEVVAAAEAARVQAQVASIQARAAARSRQQDPGLLERAGRGLSAVAGVGAQLWRQATGPAESAPPAKAEPAEKLDDPGQEAPQQANEVADDGFDITAAQAEMDAMLLGYKNLNVGGFRIQTNYKMGESFKRDMIHARADQNWTTGGSSEMGFWDFSGRSAKPKTEYFGVTGKAGPRELEKTLEMARDAGRIHEFVGKDPATAALTQADIQAFADDFVGVDCSGFVTRMLTASSQFKGIRTTEKESGHAAHRLRASLDSMEGSEDFETLPKDPTRWRTMDVIGFAKADRNRGVGHVMIIYSVAAKPDGTFEVTIMESNGGSRDRGPRKDVAHCDANGIFANDGSNLSNTLYNRYRVLRPKVRREEQG